MGLGGGKNIPLLGFNNKLHRGIKKLPVLLCSALHREHYISMTNAAFCIAYTYIYTHTHTQLIYTNLVTRVAAPKITTIKQHPAEVLFAVRK